MINAFLLYMFRDKCLPIMINQHRIWKLKLECKDLLFIAFQQKQTQNPTKPCMSRQRTMVYPVTGKPCWVLIFSALLVALFFRYWLWGNDCWFDLALYLALGLVSWVGRSLSERRYPSCWVMSHTGFIVASYVSLVVVLLLFCWIMNFDEL